MEARLGRGMRLLRRAKGEVALEEVAAAVDCEDMFCGVDSCHRNS